MRIKLALGFVAGLMFALTVFADETISIDTYYPSPDGVYSTLRLFPNDNFTPGAACSNEGEMYYDNSDHGLYACKGSPATWQWVDGYWVANGANNIRNSNSGNVSIGTTAATHKLTVGNGKINASGGLVLKHDGAPASVENGDIWIQ